MPTVNLRDSLLVKLRDSRRIYTLNCLESLSAAQAQLVIHNHVLESILLASRRAIAQSIHLFDYAKQEVSHFIQSEISLRKSLEGHGPDHSCVDLIDPLSTRFRFINMLGNVQGYIDSYTASFRSDYQSLISCANRFNYREGSNPAFVEALTTCKSLTELDMLIDSHGGQIDYDEEYYPVLSEYHSTFSFTRNLLRDASDSHAMSDSLELFLPSFFDYLEHFSRQSLPQRKPKPTYDFLERCTVFLAHLDKLTYDDTCRLFHIVDHRSLPRS